MNQLQKANIININVKALDSEVSRLKALLADNQNQSLNDIIIGLIDNIQTDLHNVYQLSIENAHYPKRVKIKDSKFYTQYKDAFNKPYWVEVELISNHKFISEL